MKRTIHVCQSVEGALANWNRAMWESIAVDNGITVDEVKAEFQAWKREGVKVIPMGERCKGFSDETGCPGHEHKGEEK